MNCILVKLCTVNFKGDAGTIFNRFIVHVTTALHFKNNRLPQMLFHTLIRLTIIKEPAVSKQMIGFTVLCI